MNEYTHMNLVFQATQTICLSALEVYDGISCRPMSLSFSSAVYLLRSASQIRAVSSRLYLCAVERCLEGTTDPPQSVASEDLCMSATQVVIHEAFPFHYKTKSLET